MKTQTGSIDQLKTRIDQALKQNYVHFKTLAEFVWCAFNSGCDEPPQDPDIDFHAFLTESTETAIDRLTGKIEKAFSEFSEEGAAS